MLLGAVKPCFLLNTFRQKAAALDIFSYKNKHKIVVFLLNLWYIYDLTFVPFRANM